MNGRRQGGKGGVEGREVQWKRRGNGAGDVFGNPPTVWFVVMFSALSSLAAPRYRPARFLDVPRFRPFCACRARARSRLDVAWPTPLMFRPREHVSCVRVIGEEGETGETHSGEGGDLVV